MARTSLGIVLFLITTSGCAGRPWLARGGTHDLAAALVQDRDGPPVSIPSTPGFYEPPAESAAGSQANIRKPSAQSSPYGLASNPSRTGRTSLRQQDLYGVSYGKPIDAPNLATIPGSEYLPFQAGAQAAMPPGFQQTMAKSIVDEMRRQDAATLAATNELTLTTTQSNIKALDMIRATAFNNFQDAPGLDAPVSDALSQSPLADPFENRYGTLPQDNKPKELDGQAVQWREAVMKMLSSIKMELMKSGLSTSERIRLNVMQRHLYAFLNETEKALAPIKDVDADISEYWKFLSHSLIISLDVNEDNTSSRRAALSLRELGVADDHLANISRLDVRNLAFCNKVSSYGRFDEFKSYGFKPGQEVLLYVEVENFAVESTSNRYETELQGEYTIFDVEHKRIASAGLPLDKQFSTNRRHDYFIAYRIFMPKKIERGHYLMQLTIEDIKGSKSNQSTLEFWIR